MLQTIREYTQGWIAGAVISIIILSFALWGVHSYFVGGGSDSHVAEVNGVEISKEQLTLAYERLRRQMQAQHGASARLTAKDEGTLKSRALQTLIDIEALKQASVAQHFYVSDRQIDNYLQSMPEFQVNGQFSLTRLQEILSSTLLSTSEFLELIKTSLLIDQPKLGIILTSFALPDETAHTISLVNQTRDVNYISIPLSYFISHPIVISTQKIQNYYNKNKKDFMTPEQINVDYIELSLKAISAKMNPTDAMLKNFYNENINSYTQPMQWKFASLTIPIPPNALPDELKKLSQTVNTYTLALREGEDLAKIAKKSGGHVLMENWMPLNKVMPELQKAVASLNKAGQIANPFKTSKGWVIIKAMEVQEPKIQPFDTVKNRVKEIYIHQHAEEKFAELRDQLADLTYEHPSSLQYAAKTLDLPIQTSELFTKEKAGRDISQYKKVRDTAFSNDVLHLQNNSDVIQLNPETVIVFRVKSYLKSSLLPLILISSQIEDKLKTQEAENLTKNFANDLKSKLESGTEAQQLANTYKLQWKSTGLIGRYSTKVDSAILDLAFRLPDPALSSKKVSYGTVRLPSGYALVALKSVKEGQISDKKQFAVFKEQIQNSEGLLEYELYKQSQLNHAKIKTNVSMQ